MKVVSSFETSGIRNSLTQRDKSEKVNRQHQRCENPEYHWEINLCFGS
jgi:hypothetical protein